MLLIFERKKELDKLKQQYQTLGENFSDGVVYLIGDNFEYALLVEIVDTAQSNSK